MVSYQNHRANMVRMAGFEPASFRRQILSLLCMPFHHIRNILIICYLQYKVNYILTH